MRGGENEATTLIWSKLSGESRVNKATKCRWPLTLMNENLKEFNPRGIRYCYFQNEKQPLMRSLLTQVCQLATFTRPINRTEIKGNTSSPFRLCYPLMRRMVFADDGSVCLAQQQNSRHERGLRVQYERSAFRDKKTTVYFFRVCSLCRA